MTYVQENNVEDGAEGEVRGPNGTFSPKEFTIIYKSGAKLTFRSHRYDELNKKYLEHLDGTEKQKVFKFNLPRVPNTKTHFEVLVIDFSEVASILEVGSNRWSSTPLYGAADFGS